MICLSTDTIDDLILYLGSKEEHALDFLNISFNDNDNNNYNSSSSCCC